MNKTWKRINHFEDSGYSGFQNIDGSSYFNLFISFAKEPLLLCTMLCTRRSV